MGLCQALSGPRGKGPDPDETSATPQPWNGAVPPAREVRPFRASISLVLSACREAACSSFLSRKEPAFLRFQASLPQRSAAWKRFSGPSGKSRTHTFEQATSTSSLRAGPASGWGRTIADAVAQIGTISGLEL